MAVTQPYLLPKPETILTLPGSNIKHPLRKMILGVLKISGKISAVEAYQRTLPVLSSVAGEAVLQYGTYLQKWLSFCSVDQIEQFNPSLNCFVEFLNKLSYMD